jgi:kynurenine 3-monooxygenase
VSKNKITIAGAGLAGSLLSIYLSRKGFAVDIYERRGDMRTENIDGGRSINLALSTRGIHALKEVGLYDEIKKISIPMYGRMIHHVKGEQTFQRYGKDDTEYINAVSRAELNKSLMNLAEKEKNVKFYFHQAFKSVRFETGEVILNNEKNGENTKIITERIIAADGAWSAVRREMQKMQRFNYSQEYENYGYKELTIPSGPNSSFHIEKNCLHIWPRGSFMLIALPNLDGSFTCTLFLAYDTALGGENSFEYLTSEENVKKFFNKQFPDAEKLMPKLAEEFFGNPTGSLVTVKCYPWRVKDKAVMVGDACHAIVPFFGQGMNAAFEDCTYLNSLIDEHKDDWEKIFEEYQQIRKPNADAIADLAQENFIEMRDLVAEPKFQLKKKIESELYIRYPDKFIPKYTMVTFMRMPYTEALSKGKRQDLILNELTEGINTFEEVDWKKAESLIQ